MCGVLEGIFWVARYLITGELIVAFALCANKIGGIRQNSWLNITQTAIW